MANTFHTVCQTVLVFLFLFAVVKCGEIEFTSNVTSKPDELTMRCSLKNASPHTVDHIKAIIITESNTTDGKVGKNVALITPEKPATFVDNTTEGVQVAGQLQQSGQELGFLKVVWRHPVSTLNGKYNCFIYGNGESVHVKLLVVPVTVQIEQVKYDDLVESVRQLKLINDRQEESVRQLMLINDRQKRSRVMFTVSLKSGKHFNNNEAIVFDNVTTNIGGGYNTSSGEFTCPFDGYYVFQLHLMAQYNKGATVFIQVNGKSVRKTYARSKYYGASSSSVTLLLKRGDKVRVTSHGSSYVEGRNWSSFSGYLLTLK